MAEGRSNQGIADALVITLRAVEKYVSSIFGKLGLPPGERVPPRPRCASLPAFLTRHSAEDARNPPPGTPARRLPSPPWSARFV